VSNSKTIVVLTVSTSPSFRLSVFAIAAPLTLFHVQHSFRTSFFPYSLYHAFPFVKGFFTLTPKRSASAIHVA
jgi:hypothetical protein